MLLNSGSWRGRVLIIEEAGARATTLRLALARANYTSACLAIPIEAVTAIAARPPDLVFLNPAVLQRHGLDLSGFIRCLQSQPLVVLSPRPRLKEKLLALESGADDYLGRPLHFKELVLRSNNLVRRHQAAADRHILEMGPLRIDRARRKVYLEGETLHLTGRQFDLLKYFFENPKRLISRDELLNQIWNIPTPVETNIVETTLNVLRRKIWNQEHQFICTLRGGYSMGEVIHRAESLREWGASH
jgi:DNA-binding response OmpR family regulator